MKNKSCKLMTCWMKSIIAAKSIHQLRAVTTPYRDYVPSIFTKKSLTLGFFKNLTPYKYGGGGVTLCEPLYWIKLGYGYTLPWPSHIYYDITKTKKLGEVNCSVNIFFFFGNIPSMINKANTKKNSWWKCILHVSNIEKQCYILFL